MSFILDALKKSETDRQRNTGPALFEVKVAPPKAGFPVWAIAIVVLLVINMAIVGWLLLRKSSKADETVAQNASTAVTSQPAAAAPPVPTRGPARGQSDAQYNNVAEQAHTGAGTQQYDPSQVAGSSSEDPAWQRSQRGTGSGAGGSGGTGGPNEPTLGGGAGSGAGRFASSGSTGGAMARGGGGFGSGADSGSDDVGATGAGSSGEGADGRLGGRGRVGANAALDAGARLGANATVGPGARAGGGGAVGGSGNPDDDAPAQDPGAPLFKGHVRRGTESGLMLYQDVAVTNGANLPELRLDMHVYDPKPQARFALINMRKVTEGQIVGDGVKVEAITPEGVVLSHNGTKFLLPRE